MQLLSQGGAELVEECSQDDWRIKAWKGLVKLDILGSHIRATAVEFLPQGKVPPPKVTPSLAKLSQGGIEPERRGCQDAGRRLEKIFMRGGPLQAAAVKSVPLEKVLPSEAVPSSSKLSQGRAEPGRRCCQDTWRTKARRSCQTKDIWDSDHRFGKNRVRRMEATGQGDSEDSQAGFLHIWALGQPHAKDL